MAGEPALHEFPSWRSFWIFQQSVRSELRYVRTAASETFLQTVLETCRERVGNLKAGSHFWRAQLGHDWRLTGPEEAEIEIPCAYSASRMKPLSGRASDGRANPRGIPSLYVATTKETAMSEVRPWVGSYVSVGQLRMLQDLKVVDCTRGHQKTPFYLEEPDADHRKEAVWSHIDRAFAEPLARSDDEADYAATQILAETFKQAGYGGVAYKSAFGKDGYNIALFNPDVAKVVNCGLFRVKEIELTFEAADDFWFMREPTGEAPSEPTSATGS